jgi:hypothetical protein|tara:strand:- start:500 stop:886 length:387 start_codon:yes stop_codon:yes gene_type:complete
MEKSMQAYFLWQATILSVITFYVHTFIGGPRVAAPLLADKTLPVASKWLNYYCWHITTLYTLIMGGAYAYVALFPDKIELIVFLCILNFSFSILSFLVALKAKINPFRFPSTSLFFLVALSGLTSLLI